jgi:hypothetical protein
LSLETADIDSKTKNLFQIYTILPQSLTNFKFNCEFQAHKSLQKKQFAEKSLQIRGCANNQSMLGEFPILARK